MTTGAVVLAAGHGRRFGGDVSKQFVPLAGRPVVTHSVDALIDHPAVDDVWVVGSADELQRLREATSDRAGRYLTGGAQRTDSTRAAVAAADGVFDLLLVHDAARPLLDATVITRVVQALSTADAVATAVPVADTIVEVEDGRHVQTLDRSRLGALQTPQGFRTTVLADAYRRSKGEQFTDDVSFVAATVPGVVTAMVAGDPALHKLTTPQDLAVLEAWLTGR